MVTETGEMQKCFIDEQQLLEDSYRLAARIHASGFRPDFIVGVWRGGAAVGIYVQECLQYFGIESDHIAVRTSYGGRDDYFRRLRTGESIQAHGLGYLVDRLEAHHKLLIVDDVFSTGRHIDAIVERLRKRCRRNFAGDLRVAAAYYRPPATGEGAAPDFFQRQSDDWLVLPYEIRGIDRDEMARQKPWLLPILDDLKPDWR